jgi:potassium efflux system protein
VFLLVLAIVLLARFWGFDARVSEFFGGIVLTEVNGDTALTLWDVLVSLSWVAGAHFLVYNLSGLFEFLVFPLVGSTDAGGRYVSLALARYAILLVAYSAALLALHFSFASLGWVLAAASVGIGFGLQEIIANFVSGLILLVERPIRVGDIITVGNTGGTVDRINIRATIVTNWDRQQIIVPNKEFVTKDLTNWTRNDVITRRKIAVGVRYGTDVAKVLRLLNDVAEAHPRVLRDPPPRIWFMNFGESSLDFEIWFFTRIDDGFPAITSMSATRRGGTC